jgi:cellobiose transport system substrate-binding protein
MPRMPKAGRLGVMLVAAALLAGCSTDSSNGKTKITLGLFGNFGYAELIAEYERQNPNIDIVERPPVAYKDHHTSLATHLATGKGAADIEAVDTGYIARFKQNPDQFVDLNTKGGAELRDRWLSWKWEASLAKDGRQIGFGTDVGGLAICYRRDLLEQAGLPTDREELAKQWSTWDQFFELGARFQEKAPPGVKWFDGGPTVLNAIIGQQEVGYYDRTDKIVVGTNPAVKKSWDQVMRGIGGGMSAGLLYSTPSWDTGFRQSQFATVTCPAWQMVKVKDKVPDAAGKWDLAAVPGGGGNWGGSYLTVPKQGEHIDEAVRLAAWLTAPEQQVKVFLGAGLLPSTPSLYDRPEIVNYRNEFFNNAPVGSLFTTAARELNPQYQGPRAGDIQTEIGNAVLRVEQGKQTPEQSWSQFVDDVNRLTS